MKFLLKGLGKMFNPARFDKYKIAHGLNCLKKEKPELTDCTKPN